MEESKGARVEAKRAVRPESLTDAQIQPMIEGTTYEKWFNALKKTRNVREFASMKTLAFLDRRRL